MSNQHKQKAAAREARQKRQAKNVLIGIGAVLIVLAIAVIASYSLLN